ncbi:MAG: cytochrome c maturation protein CcmE [candidate division Zixibacteria bacterium]
MKTKYIAGLLIIAVFVTWGLYSFVSTTVTYVPLTKVSTTQGTVQVMGKIDFDAVNYNAEESRLEFVITDLENPESDFRLKVIYGGVVPGNFEQATSVVAKGRYDNGVFVADQLLVKCPSKYQGLDQEA